MLQGKGLCEPVAQDTGERRAAPPAGGGACMAETNILNEVLEARRELAALKGTVDRLYTLGDYFLRRITETGLLSGGRNGSAS